MIKIKTLQTFLMEYHVPEKDYPKFMVSFNNGKHDIDLYEVDQKFLGEHIVHNTRDCQKLQSRQGHCTTCGRRSDEGTKPK